MRLKYSYATKRELIWLQDWSNSFPCGTEAERETSKIGRNIIRYHHNFPGAPVMVARTEDKKLAAFFVVLTKNRQNIYLKYLMTVLGFQGQGVGSTILRYVQSTAPASVSVISTPYSNGFYKRLGGILRNQQFWFRKPCK